MIRRPSPRSYRSTPRWSRWWASRPPRQPSLQRLRIATQDAEWGTAGKRGFPHDAPPNLGISASRNSDVDRLWPPLVEVSLSKPEELPCVMGLVRQAFEKQMGNAEAEA